MIDKIFVQQSTLARSSQIRLQALCRFFELIRSTATYQPTIRGLHVPQIKKNDLLVCQGYIEENEM